ncbi:MAG: TolC family protein [Azospirillum sp.]|nr:TolC family protein [Azospirillum sp.]
MPSRIAASPGHPVKAGSASVFFACCLVGLVLAAPQAAPAETLAHRHRPEAPGAVGASVEELLALVRKMNPELAASGLEAEAAAARIEGADALPDPKFQVQVEDIARNPSGLPRSRIGTAKYLFRQEFPLWGKRGLKREIAEAESRQAEGKLAGLLTELAMRVKTTYAEYHLVHLATDQTDELLNIVRALGRLAQLRYAQGMGQQQEPITAEAERAALTSERLRLDGDRRRLRARLNALIGRAPDQPLVEQPRPRPLPDARSLDFNVLRERAQAANPLLRIEAARIEAADGTRSLADRAWYPDLGVGVGVVQKNNTLDSYQAMVEVNIPLQWGLRRSQQAEATAMASAARSRRDAVSLNIDADLQVALAGLDAATGMVKVLRDTGIPQARIAVQSALKSYEIGLGEITPVLDGVQRLQRAFIDLLKVQFEQQARLAEIERTIGGDL